jgi:hypothetical protein
MAITAIKNSLRALYGSSNIAEVDWTGDGSDSIDDGFGTIYRTSSFRVVGSGR